MPIWPSKQSKESQRLLEHKLYLARERPDELFDLSDCSLKEIPNGTFSLVKVLLKQNLRLQRNALRTLESGGNISDLFRLVELDISCNEIRQLPDNLGHLTALEVGIFHLHTPIDQLFNCSDNRIKTLPSSIGRLERLHTLNVQNNRIAVLPLELSELEQVTRLLLSGNPLTRLPTQLLKLHKLDELTVPLDSIRHPPRDVCERGVGAIIRFLRGDHLPTEETTHVTHSSTCTYSPSAPVPSSTIELMDSRRQRALQLEREMDESDQVQLELVAKANKSRQRVLGQLADEDDRLHADIVAVQRRRDTDRLGLVSSLLHAEDSATELIRTLISRHQAIQLGGWEEDVNILHLPTQTDESFQLRKKEILVSMNNMLSVTDKAYEGHIAQRQSDRNRVLAETDWTDRNVEQVLIDRQKKHQLLTSKIALEEDVQKAAFSKLQTLQDSQAQRLRRDIGLIEQELCLLTMAEQNRKAKRAELNLHCLNSRRSDLVRLLKQLNDEHDKRQAELRKRLEELEQRREDDQMDYWLIQYQQLLDKKPAALDIKLEQGVLEILKDAGATDFEPNFQRHRITCATMKTMTEEDLKKIGVHLAYIRRAILAQVDERQSAEKLAHMKLSEANSSSGPIASPSAPPMEQPHVIPVEPSAPPAQLTARVENECCVCQNAKCIVIFLPCGHVCACDNCSTKLAHCPLCRSVIDQRIRLQY